MGSPLSVLCGQLLVVGLKGPTLTAHERALFRSGLRGGVTLFKRNVAGEGLDALRGVRELTRELDGIVAIDQEGGRVVRLRAPALALPPMARIGGTDVDFARRLATAQARELAALGITMSFAPVADVHTRPENPIVGDRAFSSDPREVARFAAAWAEGLAAGGVRACAKHFPGHGDTTVDSHLALPRVDRDRAGLEAIEIAPFRALAKNPAVHAMMTAHVVYDALDAERPATLAPAIATDLLRRDLGFTGVLFSDDLEMKAIQGSVGASAVAAIRAGCDVLLVCTRADLAEEAHRALVQEAESKSDFRTRLEEAHARRKTLAIARSSLSLDAVLAANAAIAQELSERLS